MKVSGQHPEYSRFPETRAGDRRDQHCVVYEAVVLSDESARSLRTLALADATGPAGDALRGREPAAAQQGMRSIEIGIAREGDGYCTSLMTTSPSIASGSELNSGPRFSLIHGINV